MTEFESSQSPEVNVLVESQEDVSPGVPDPWVDAWLEGSIRVPQVIVAPSVTLGEKVVESLMSGEATVTQILTPPSPSQVQRVRERTEKVHFAYGIDESLSRTPFDMGDANFRRIWSVSANKVLETIGRYERWVSDGRVYPYYIQRDDMERIDELFTNPKKAGYTHGLLRMFQASRQAIEQDAQSPTSRAREYRDTFNNRRGDTAESIRYELDSMEISDEYFDRAQGKNEIRKRQRDLLFEIQDLMRESVDEALDNSEVGFIKTASSLLSRMSRRGTTQNQLVRVPSIPSEMRDLFVSSITNEQSRGNFFALRGVDPKRGR